MKIFREMLFLEGYSSRPQDLVDARDCDDGQPRQRVQAGQPLLKTLWLLGGRPMHRGHNFDLDEETEYTALPSPATAACTPGCRAG